MQFQSYAVCYTHISLESIARLGKTIKETTVDIIIFNGPINCVLYAVKGITALNKIANGICLR